MGAGMSWGGRIPMWQIYKTDKKKKGNERGTHGRWEFWVLSDFVWKEEKLLLCHHPSRGECPVWDKTNLMQQFSVLSEHANITMLFTLKDNNTLVAKPLFHLTTSKRPIDYSKWPLPNIHYDCHLSTIQPLRCRGRPNPHGFECSRWNGKKLQTVTAQNRELKKKTCFCAWNRKITKK